MITEYKREIQNYSYSIILKHNVTAIKLMQGVRTTLIYIILKRLECEHWSGNVQELY